MNILVLQHRLGNNLAQFAGAYNMWGEREDGTPNFTAIIDSATQERVVRFMIPDLTVGSYAEVMRRFADTPLMRKSEAYTCLWHPSCKWKMTPEIMRKYVRLVPVEDQPECVVHIRGGDWEWLIKYKEFVVQREYLLEALERVGVAPEDAVVCTDSLRLAHRVLPEARIVSSARPELHLCVAQDFARCVGARFFIMSPSTFSLYAAYMGNHEKVIFPSRWPSQTHACLHARKDPPYDMAGYIRPNYEVARY